MPGSSTSGHLQNKNFDKNVQVMTEMQLILSQNRGEWSLEIFLSRFTMIQSFATSLKTHCETSLFMVKYQQAN